MSTIDIVTPETTEEPTPEWYSAQVQKLCDIRGFLYSLMKEDSGGDESLPDMVKRMFSELQAKKKRLRDALQSLYDEQNGPPLLRHEKNWQAAMDEAETLLGDK